MSSLFSSGCRFVLSAPAPEALPPARLPEIAFIGRSNVGKSSLINALAGQKNLAKASTTPGRTQALNFFLVGEKLLLVDLPGYGYAKAPPAMVRAWGRLVRGYLSHRPVIRRVLVLIDARRGLMDSDHEMMALLDDAAVSYQAVLTKADKIGAGELRATAEALQSGLSRHPAAHPQLHITSAQKGTGIKELRNALASALKDR